MNTNINDTTPAAPSGKVNVTWQKDGAGNVSASYTTWPFLPPVSPPSSSWTWVHQGTATATVNPNGNLFLQFQNFGSNVGSAYLRTKPGASYTIVIGMRMFRIKTLGIALYDSASDKLVCSFFDMTGGPTAYCFQYNASSYSFNSREFSDITEGIDSLIWQKIVEDGTNRTFYISPDGYNWVQYAQVAAGTYIVPTHMGIGCDCSLSANHGNASIFHFSLTSP